ncbi:MAG: hypothetical protein J6S19_05705 [Lentisphaeria bacterium]|nr:hypothetical protein [Lentisphaeria bacterium]
MENKTFTGNACADCESVIVAGTLNEHPAALKHLQECSACRAFADFQKQLMSLAPAVPGDTPSWNSIRQEHARRRKNRRNILRFTIPAAVAAAAVLAVGGFYMQMDMEPQQPVYSGYMLAADADIFAAAWEENSVTLAWDQLSSKESACIDSLAAANNGSQWSIEMFTPYNIEEF